MKKWKAGVFIFILAGLLIQEICADTYRKPPRHDYSYQGRRGYSAPPNYARPEGYFACPRGDYISDRPGRCPLDGSVLVPRQS